MPPERKKRSRSANKIRRPRINIYVCDEFFEKMTFYTGFIWKIPAVKALMASVLRTKLIHRLEGARGGYLGRGHIFIGVSPYAVEAAGNEYLHIAFITFIKQDPDRILANHIFGKRKNIGFEICLRFILVNERGTHQNNVFHTHMVHFSDLRAPLLVRKSAADGIPILALRLIVMSEFKPGTFYCFHGYQYRLILEFN